jgi:nitrate/nitrite transporter NarK
VKKLLSAALLDVVAVVVFCVIGRRSHDEAGALTGLIRTLWPFLGGLAIGWATADRLRAAPTGLYPFGVIVWFCTLVGGMILRVVDDQGTAISFVIVAGFVLAAFLLGWRAVFRLVERRMTARRDANNSV